MTLRKKDLFGAEAKVSRRALLGGAAAALVLPVAACGRGGDTAAAQNGARKIGIQLYTLRDSMAQDVSSTLARVAGIGYREVEFAGYFDRSPAEVRQSLDAEGLAAPSAHVSAAAIDADIDAVIEAAGVVGHEWIVIPWLPVDKRTLEDYRQWADFFNRAGERVRSAGLKLAYHNHDFEFETVDGAVPFDLLMERTDPGLVSFELDLFWARKAERDIIALLGQAPERFPLCHVKDMSPDGAMVDVGAGVIDFAQIFSRRESRFAHFFVEHDQPAAPFESARTSYGNLSSIFAAAASR